MTEHNFPPELIFNFDETMLDASGHKLKVFVSASLLLVATFALCVFYLLSTFQQFIQRWNPSSASLDKQMASLTTQFGWNG